MKLTKAERKALKALSMQCMWVAKRSLEAGWQAHGKTIEADVFRRTDFQRIGCRQARAGCGDGLAYNICEGSRSQSPQEEKGSHVLGPHACCSPRFRSFRLGSVVSEGPFPPFRSCVPSFSSVLCRLFVGEL